MKNQLFANVSVSTKEDVAEAIKIYKSFVPANEEEHKKAVEALLDVIEEGNRENERRAIYECIKSEDIIKYLIPTIDLNARDLAKSNVRRNAVHLAVSYAQFKIVEDKKNYIVRTTYAPVTVAKVVKFLADLEAFGHAENRTTKADREKALAKVMNGAERVLQLFCTGAFAYENIADKLPNIIRMSEEEVAVFGGTPSKAKAEKQIKALAKALNIEGDFHRVHGLALYKKCYTLDAKMTPKTADITTILQAFITISRFAVNKIDLPDLVDKGGVLLAEKEVDTNEVFTFN